MRIWFTRTNRAKSVGMTLIETVAGLAILGTLISSLVVARSRYQHQWVLAGRRSEATVAADTLLSSWWAQPAQLPRNAAGKLTDKKLRWQTHLVDPSVDVLGVQIVRLEIFDDRTGTELPAAGSANSLASPLACVDIVLNPPQTQEGQPTASEGVAP